MSLIGGLVGGMIGFTFLGPLGALIGSVVGSRMGRNSVRRKNPNNLDHQVAFFAALFACLAKIAKADGQVTKEEINKIEDFITQKFNLDGEQRNFAINIFQKAKDDNVSFDAYAKQLASLLKRSPNSLMIFYELLFELAMADGELHPNEEKLLKRVPRIFGFNDGLYNKLFQKYGMKTQNFYEVLGVSKQMNFDEIRKIYLKKRREFHPDKLISKGLPEELIEKAKEKFIEIQEAYEELEKIHKK
jgi:DnaJ like chaperone protein